VSAPTVRRLGVDDLAAAQPLLLPEGWNFELHELARLHKLGGAVGAFQGNELVGFLSFVDFPPVRWVGNVVVSPKVRGEGIGARMVAETTRDAATTGLYAVEKAVTLYERAGFVAQGEAWAYRAPAAQPRAPTPTEPLRASDLLDIARFDRASTGMDRGLLLRALFAAYPDTARVVRRAGRVEGYGFAKVSPEVTELGPIVARDAETAADLLDALLSLTNGPYEMTILGDNRKARSNAVARGFLPAFRTVPMFHGPPPAWRPTTIAAAAGLEKG
jgi:GNAT superfamily N-acetyltransferase